MDPPSHSGLYCIVFVLFVCYICMYVRVSVCIMPCVHRVYICVVCMCVYKIYMCWCWGGHRYCVLYTSISVYCILIVWIS